MGNKTTTKKTTPAKRAAAKAAPEAATETTLPAPATIAKPKRTRATKPAAVKKAATPKRTRGKATVMAKGFTTEDIALRAYYIAEKRQRTGEYGTPEGDWLEAERQLMAEAAS